MTKNWQERQADFMRACAQDIRTLHAATTFADVDDRRRKLQTIILWTNLINEECTLELLRELRHIRSKYEFAEYKNIALHEIESVYDGIIDTIYVLCGLANAMGLNIEAGFQEVHLSNMAKVGLNGKVIKREDGKVLKPLGWKAPQLGTILAAQIDEEKYVASMKDSLREGLSTEWQVELTRILGEMSKLTTLDNPISMDMKDNNIAVLNQVAEKLQELAADAATLADNLQAIKD